MCRELLIGYSRPEQNTILCRYPSTVQVNQAFSRYQTSTVLFAIPLQKKNPFGINASQRLFFLFQYSSFFFSCLLVKSPPDLDAGDFEYDVFLTYCRKDFSWVDKELLPLFNHNQVKYCVDFIHSELGKAFLQSMVEGIYKSRKVLAVWSANYASSKYCKQELDYALQRSFEKSDTAVIIIRIDWTDPTRLPKTLRTKTFLDYYDSAERKGWEKRLIRHLKPPKQPKKMIVSIV